VTCRGVQVYVLVFLILWHNYLQSPIALPAGEETLASRTGVADIFARLRTEQPKYNGSHADRGKKFIYVPERPAWLWNAPLGTEVSIAGSSLPGNESDHSFYVLLVPCVPSWRGNGQLWFYALCRWLGGFQRRSGGTWLSPGEMEFRWYIFSKTEQHAAESRYTYYEARQTMGGRDERDTKQIAESWQLATDTGLKTSKFETTSDIVVLKVS